MSREVEIKAIISYGYDSNVYIVKDSKLALIDAGTGLNESFNQRIFSEIGDREVDIIINTHAHFDHCGGNKIFMSESTKIAVHEQDYEAIRKKHFYGTKSFFDFYQKKENNQDKISEEVNEKQLIILRANDVIDLGKMKLSIIHTPGHSKGSICLLSNNIKGKTYLFSGDTLFAYGAFGRFDLAGGNLKELINSLKRLKSMEFNILMPGHGDIAENGKKQAEKALKGILAYAGD